MRRKWKPLLLILLLLVSIIGISGFSCSDYKTFTLKKGIAHLSFRYPSRYEIYDIDLGDIYLGASTTVDLYTEPLKNPAFHDAQICIYIYKTDENVSNSNEDMESYIASWSRADGFKIMERSSVTVAGIQGTQIVYYRASHLIEDIHYGMHIIKTPVIVRKVFFDYNHQIWRISVMGHESLADTIKADFIHVIDTFKILN